MIRLFLKVNGKEIMIYNGMCLKVLNLIYRIKNRIENIV